jgi:PIN domain nuclease of toxin-antitoxin system
MKVLIDTHVFLWMLSAPEKLSFETRTVLEDLRTQVFMSAASYYEICYKHKIGKLPDYDDVANRLDMYAFQLSVKPLAIAGEHAALAGRLEWKHSDPFDRLIASQAISEDLVLLTEDAAFKQLSEVKIL